MRLTSHLVNLPDDGVAFARTAAAHLRPGGLVIGETYPPGVDPIAGVGHIQRLGDAFVELTHVERVGDRLDAEVRYGVDRQTWTQTFQPVVLDEAGLRALLADAGLAFERWLERPGWFVATLA